MTTLYHINVTVPLHWPSEQKAGKPEKRTYTRFGQERANRLANQFRMRGWRVHVRPVSETLRQPVVDSEYLEGM